MSEVSETSPSGASAPVQQQIFDLRLSIEKERLGRQGHEDLCAERYKGIDEGLKSLRGDFGEMVEAMKTLAKTQERATGFDLGVAAARKAPWWVAPTTAVFCVFLTAAIACFGWMFSQLIGHLEQPAAIVSTKITH